MVKLVTSQSSVLNEPDWSQTYSDVLDIASAHGAWTEVVRELSSVNTLSIANGPMIERLVRFRVVYDRCARDIAETGPIVLARRTKARMQNPSWSVLCKASEMITGLEIELGIPPARRAKAGKITREKSGPRPAEAYLRPVSS